MADEYRMCTKFEVDVFKNGVMTKTCWKNNQILPFSLVSRSLFFDRFLVFRKCFSVFFVFFSKILPKNMCCSAISRFVFCLTFFTGWQEMTLTCISHKALVFILASVSDTIHADKLALFAFNKDYSLAKLIHPEKSNIFTLTWPVTSQWPPGPILILFG